MKVYWVIKCGERYMVRPDVWARGSPGAGSIAVRFWSRAAAKASLPARPGARVVRVVVRARTRARLPAAAQSSVKDAALQRQRDMDHERRKDWSAKGLCTRCGSQTGGDFRMCPDCRAEKRIKQANRCSERMAACICIGCGKAPSVGHRLCVQCSAVRSARLSNERRTRNAERAMRRKEGLCTRCGCRLQDGDGAWCRCCLGKRRTVRQGLAHYESPWMEASDALRG